MTFLSYFIILFVLLFLLWGYWRFYFFFRDPGRIVPKGKNLVSPADGKIVYVKKVKHNEIPIPIKRGRKINLEESVKTHLRGEKYLIGIFMNPFSVHVNRAPIAGTVKKIHHYQHKNLPMTLMWLRTMLNLRPFHKFSTHMWENERNIILIQNKFPVYVIQIADLAVNKVVCWVKKNQKVSKGQRFGMIKMGSQVDVLVPSKHVKLVVKEGDNVRAGESILAKVID
ncbi:phosphatidylserine decarboxylase [Candidatus Woesearchaeota archaeon]|jgi:phosphatidylserine decarboxylase|nr:phosphatidylserine decarboxylase [Candidatus Woesearchaeota archaeon]